ncbi:MAG: hypothetical protein HOP23_05885 [Methylococcaceae bacterium]|nr:hypothetical protein [Methylococcaceae bacterium]
MSILIHFITYHINTIDWNIFSVTKQYYENFYRCSDCQQIYWEGPHVEKVKDHFTAYFSHGDLTEQELTGRN